MDTTFSCPRMAVEIEIDGKPAVIGRKTTKPRRQGCRSRSGRALRSDAAQRGYTLGCMAGKSARPSPCGRGQADAPQEREPQPQHKERCGPLVIARQRKGDGRALILYTRDDRRHA